jgi:hypothetical protein
MRSVRGDEEIRPVMLADCEQIETELVGELDLLDQLAHPLHRARAGGEVSEGREAELHRHTA